MTFRAPLILVAEHSRADQLLFTRALEATGSRSRLHFVENGPAVLAFLRSSPVQPHLIVLDLNLPGKNGIEVLKDLKSEPILHRIPVVILSSSRNPDHILLAYDLNANCYIFKPVDLEALFSTIQAIEAFWVGLVTPPPNGFKTILS